MTPRLRFLSTFAPDAPAPEQPAAPVVSPAPVVPAFSPVAPSSTVPAGMVLDLAKILAEKAAAPAAPSPPAAPTPAAPAVDPRDVALAQVTAANAQLQAQFNRMQLDIYQANAINAARANGEELIDAIVRGNTTAEIDASVQIAKAEYKQLQEQFAKKNPPVAAAPAATPAPQGTVTSTQVTPPAAPPPAAPPLSLPAFHSAPGVPDAGGNVITKEQLSYLTSAEAIRNGDYAKNRHLLHGALRSGMQGAPGQFSFSGQNVPGLVPPPGAMAPGVQPGVQTSAYAGMSVPQVAPASGQPVPTRGVPITGFQPGRAPQPAQFQQELAPGQYQQTATPSAGDMAAARAAAEAAVASRH